MGKRANGEGTVYRRSDGRWVASITLENGKRKSYYFQTQKEAMKAAQRACIARDEGTLVMTKDQTMQVFLMDWLEHIAAPQLRHSSLRRYQDVLRLHILPTLGQITLQKLSPQHVQRLYAFKKQTGCGPSTIRQIHQILHHALDDALRWNLVSRNICNVVKRPPAPKREMQALTASQAQQLLSAAQGDRLEALYVLALTTGMREGELLGLKWGDVNWQEGTICIQRIVKRVAGHGIVVSEPKTRAGRRHITLSTLSINALKKHHFRQQEARLLAGARWQNQDWIFSTRWGTPLDADFIRRTSFPQLLARAGLPRIRFHDLRHTAATLLLTLHTHPKIVQELLGHSNISITLDIYSHVTPSLQQEAVRSLERLLAI